MAKATKAQGGKMGDKTGGKIQHTWKVTRTNNQSLDVAADELLVVDGDLVFSADGVTVRVVAANTYTDVELLAPAEITEAVSALFQNRKKARGR